MVNRHRYAVVMAGGQGTRFWPLSRGGRPKQVLELFDNRSLLQLTIQRILPLFGRNNILVVTVKDQLAKVRQQLPSLPRENILMEPLGNNTAPCIGLAALELEARDPSATMAVLPADHWIEKPKLFLGTLRSAIQLSENFDAVATVGIKPRYPETGYGYIVKARPAKGPRGPRAYHVKAFKEKPHLRQAKQLVKSKALWNSGIFTWKVATLRAMLQRYAPDIHRGLERIKNETHGQRLSRLTPKGKTVLIREYKKMPNISIDHAVMERAGAAGRAITLEGTFPWSDLGSWAALHRFLPKDGRGNSAMGRWIGLEAKDCLVYSRDRLVVLLGTRGLMVVDTPDALLVGELDRAQDIRDIVKKIEQTRDAKLIR